MHPRWTLISATEQAAETYCLIRARANLFVMAGTGTEPELHAGKMAKATPGAAPLGPAVFAVLQSRQEFLPSSLWLWVHSRTSHGIIKAGQDAVPAMVTLSCVPKCHTPVWGEDSPPLLAAPPACSFGVGWKGWVFSVCLSQPWVIL